MHDLSRAGRRRRPLLRELRRGSSAYEKRNRRRRAARIARNDAQLSLRRLRGVDELRRFGPNAALPVLRQREARSPSRREDDFPNARRAVRRRQAASRRDHARVARHRLAAAERLERSGDHHKNGGRLCALLGLQRAHAYLLVGRHQPNARRRPRRLVSAFRRAPRPARRRARRRERRTDAGGNEHALPISPRSRPAARSRRPRQRDRRRIQRRPQIRPPSRPQRPGATGASIDRRPLCTGQQPQRENQHDVHEPHQRADAAAGVDHGLHLPRPRLSVPDQRPNRRAVWAEADVVSQSAGDCGSGDRGDFGAVVLHGSVWGDWVNDELAIAAVNASQSR